MFYEAMKRKAGRADKKVRGEALLCRILQTKQRQTTSLVSFSTLLTQQLFCDLIYKLLTKWTRSVYLIGTRTLSWMEIILNGTQNYGHVFVISWSSSSERNTSQKWLTFNQKLCSDYSPEMLENTFLTGSYVKAGTHSWLSCLDLKFLIVFKSKLWHCWNFLGCANICSSALNSVDDRDHSDWLTKHEKWNYVRIQMMTHSRFKVFG